MKNYLLLRDNHQSGPYTADSLQKMMLRKFDLIWIEGESIVWKYPSEIQELQHFAPVAEMTDATRVNSIKEMQMLYFQAPLNEIQYKTSHTLLTDTGIVWNEIPAGFEYLMRAQDLQIDDLGISFQKKEEAVLPGEPVHETPKSFDYTVLGESQIIDTPEVAANSSGFTTTIEMPVRHKRAAVRQPGTGKKRKQIAPGITGLLTLAAIALLNIKL